MKKLIILTAALGLIFTGCAETGNAPESIQPPSEPVETAVTTTTAAPKKEIAVTIGENQRADDIIALFEGCGLGSGEKYRELLNSGDFDLAFVNELKSESLSEDRKYLLEGYLLPGEYTFQEGTDEKAVMETVLFAFDKLWSEEFSAQAEALGLTMDEIITLASITEIETANNSDCAATASVFLNRLASPDFPKLQSDRTVLYVLDGFVRSATNDDVKLDNPYNTYIYKGLPPSAVCSPTEEAIRGTLWAEDTDYYYFINCHNGHNAYASTYAEHKANYEKYLSGEL